MTTQELGATSPREHRPASAGSAKETYTPHTVGPKSVPENQSQEKALGSHSSSKALTPLSFRKNVPRIDPSDASKAKQEIT